MDLSTSSLVSNDLASPDYPGAVQVMRYRDGMHSLEFCYQETDLRV